MLVKLTQGFPHYSSSAAEQWNRFKSSLCLFDWVSLMFNLIIPILNDSMRDSLLLWKFWIPYILAFKSINLGAIIGNYFFQIDKGHRVKFISTILRESNILEARKIITNFGPFFQDILSIWLNIPGSTTDIPKYIQYFFRDLIFSTFFYLKFEWKTFKEFENFFDPRCNSKSFKWSNKTNSRFLFPNSFWTNFWKLFEMHKMRFPSTCIWNLEFE